MTEENLSNAQKAMHVLGERAAVAFALGDELGEVTRVLQSNPSTAMLRASIRTIFALLEAFAFSLKVLALEAAKLGQVQFSKSDLRILNEGESVSQDGRERWRPCLPGVEENLRSALRCYAKARQTTTPLSSAAPLPSNFKHILELRRRVTHPKGVRELDLSKDDTTCAVDLLAWLGKVVAWFGEREQAHVVRRSEERHQSIQSQIEALRKGRPWNPDEV